MSVAALLLAVGVSSLECGQAPRADIPWLKPVCKKYEGRYERMYLTKIHTAKLRRGLGGQEPKVSSIRAGRVFVDLPGSTPVRYIVKVEGYRRVIFATKKLTRYEKLTDDNVEVREFDVASVEGVRTPFSVGESVRARKDIARGRVVFSSDVGTLFARAGDNVNVLYHANQIEITREGKLLGDVWESGQEVKVRLDGEKKYVDAVYDDKKTVIAN